MFKLLEIHDLGSKGNDFCRRKILSNKSILALVPRINNIARQRRKPNILHDLAKKMEIISTSQHHCPHLFFFCISHNSTNVLRWDAASSLGVPTNWFFMTRFSKEVLISQDSALVARGAIGVLLKSLLLVFDKSHNLVFSWVIVTTQQDCTQKQIWRENDERKRGRIKRQVFVKWGRLK